MKFTDDDIEKYLRGRMPKTTTLAFERKVKQDDNFALEVQLHKLVMKSIHYAGFCKNMFNQ